MKRSALALHEWMLKRGGWLSVRQIFYDFPTNSPTKRLSELYQAGLIVKRQGHANSRYKLYQAKEATRG